MTQRQKRAVEVHEALGCALSCISRVKATAQSILKTEDFARLIKAMQGLAVSQVHASYISTEDE